MTLCPADIAAICDELERRGLVMKQQVVVLPMPQVIKSDFRRRVDSAKALYAEKLAQRSTS